MSRRRLRVVTTVAGVAVVVAALAVGLRTGDPDPREPVALAPVQSQSVTPSGTPGRTPASEPPASPSASPSPDAAPPSPSETPAPPPPGFPELAAEVAEIRGLPEVPLDVRVLTPPAIGEVYSGLVFDELDPEGLEADRRLLVQLRLIGPDVDYRAVTEALFAEQVNGFYVPEEDVLYIGDDAAGSGAVVGAEDLSAYKQVTAAHELTHALQDVAFDLVALRDIPVAESDEALAVLSLVEGDASLVQQLWETRYQTSEQRQAAVREQSQRSGGAAAATPDYIRNGLLFPYTAGVDFVAALVGSGGFAEVDRAFREPPTTTEQILHPDRYLAGETSRPVDVEGSPGEGWSAPRAYAWGEFDQRELLAPLGAAVAERAAEGWAGGRVVGWTRGEESALGLAVTHDTPEDAVEGCEAARDWYSAVADGVPTGEPDVLRGDRDVLVLSCSELDVRLGIAADPATARRIASSQ